MPTATIEDHYIRLMEIPISFCVVLSTHPQVHTGLTNAPEFGKIGHTYTPTTYNLGAPNAYRSRDSR